MARFLSTTGVSYHLEEIIKSAQERLVLISPYLKINSRIKELLEDKDRLKIDVRVVYGKNQLQPDENNWLRSMASIRSSFCKNLHAKCYLNEGQVLITSMNLYEFSQVANNEMGILVAKDEEPELYGSIYQEAQRLIRISEEVRVSVEIVTEQEKGEALPHAAADEADERRGFCIRCGAELKLDVARPYCKSCYAIWHRYENEEYEESHCHSCGKEAKASMAKPLCYSCYKANK